MTIDAHFHMQDPNCKLTINNIKKNFKALIPELKKYNTTQINAIYWPYLVNKWHGINYQKLGDELKDEYKDEIALTTGIQFFIESDTYKEDDYNNEPKLDFIKLHGDILSDKNNQRFNDFLDFFIKKGYDKFQFHTYILTDKEINILEPYVKQGIKFYLAHGAEAINKPLMNNQIDNFRVQKMEGNLFLGTSSYKCFTNEVGYVKTAMEKGLEKLVCFETDFNNSKPEKEYNNYLEAVRKIIPQGKMNKIFEENAEKFL
ncbi:Uncharacterised protein [Candidatus Tiddalikarchaeum anstoanum]|nr:Uncharacterised protein [Candidatus Tiddalikarchaeum anstoanum]